MATANWLQPAGMATHYASERVRTALGSPGPSFPLRAQSFRKPVGWLWRQAGAHSRLPQSAFVEVALMQGSRRAHQFNREHAGQAPRTPGGPAQVDA